MGRRSRVLGRVAVVFSTAFTAGPVWAHGTAGFGSMGWADELLWLLTPVLLMGALLGWIALDAHRRSPRGRPGGRARANR